MNSTLVTHRRLMILMIVGLVIATFALRTKSAAGPSQESTATSSSNFSHNHPAIEFHLLKETQFGAPSVAIEFSRADSDPFTVILQAIGAVGPRTPAYSSYVENKQFGTLNDSVFGLQVSIPLSIFSSDALRTSGPLYPVDPVSSFGHFGL